MREKTNVRAPACIVKMSDKKAVIELSRFFILHTHAPGGDAYERFRNHYEETPPEVARSHGHHQLAKMLETAATLRGGW